MTDEQTGPVPWGPGDRDFWQAERDRAITQRDDLLAQWDAVGNLERYTPKTVWTDGRVNVGKDFADVERKKAALFYDTPTIALIPDPGTDPAALHLHQELLNTLLVRMEARATVLPTIQDCLVVVQPVPTEIGYTAVTEDMPGPPDPRTGVPVVPVVPVVVWEEIFWRRISPKALLLPVQLKDTRYDRAPWIGYQWRKPLRQVQQEYGLPPEWSGGADVPKDKPYFTPTGEATESGERMIGGVKLWYRAFLRDPAITHPDVIRVMEWIDGMPDPVVHQALPYQQIGPDGRLTLMSMSGYPLHPLALRDLTDSAWVAADCTLTAPLTRELNTFRTQILQRRDGSKLHLLVDASRVNPEVRDQIEEGTAPKIIVVEAGALEAGADKIIQQVPALTLGRESYLGQDIIERDRDGILGMNQNTSNPRGEGGKTATEIQTVQRNTDARFEQERQRALAWYLVGVQKVSALLLQYGDRVAVEMLGPQRGAQWAQARAAGQFGRFTYETVIDSGNYVDVEARKRQDLQLYNLTAKDPQTDRSALLARLATDFGIDPATWLHPQPPPAHPDPPTVSISVSPQDLDPALPSYVGTFAILHAGGVQGLPPPYASRLNPPAPDLMPHGGVTEGAPRLNQHQLSETGAPPGPDGVA